MSLGSDLERAKAEVAYAFERVPFFRKHLESAGVRPVDLEAEGSLSRVPPTRKADYRRGFPAGVLAKGYDLNTPGLYRVQSSGTEGDRLVTVTASVTFAERLMSCLSVNPAFDFLFNTLALRTIRYAAPNCSDVECSNPNSVLKDRLLPDRTLVLPVYHDLLTTPERMLEQAAREIHEYEPHFAYVDPTHLAFLVRFMRAKGMAPYALGGIAASYTLCTQTARRQLRSFFAQSPVIEVMAMSEFGWIAAECPAGNLHLNTDSYFPELLVDGRPAAVGELAELLLTSLGDEVCPHIRYQTGDLYRLLEGCSCGHAFPAVRAEGRRQNSIWRQDRVVATPREVDDVVGAEESIDLYQLSQDRPDQLAFRYVSAEPLPAARLERLRAGLEARLGAGARLTLEHTKYIPTERSGKFLCCRSQVAREREAKSS